MTIFMWIVSGLISALVACVGFIVNGFKNEMKADRAARMDMAKSFETKVDKIETILQRFSEDFIARLHRVENSANELWTEHNILKGTKEHGCSGGYIHQRAEDLRPHGTYPYRRSTDQKPFCIDLIEGERKE